MVANLYPRVFYYKYCNGCHWKDNPWYVCLFIGFIIACNLCLFLRFGYFFYGDQFTFQMVLDIIQTHPPHIKKFLETETKLIKEKRAKERSLHTQLGRMMLRLAYFATDMTLIVNPPTDEYNNSLSPQLLFQQSHPLP